MTTPLSSRRSFFKTSSALAGGSLLASAALARGAEKEAPLLVYVGTFSSPLEDMPPTQVDLPPGNGRGIHLFEMDRATGALAPVGIHEMGISPSCLALNAAGTRLYSANETDRRNAENEGSVSSFTLDPETGEPTPLNTVLSGGAGPTYLSFHPSGKYLFVANYFGGSVAVLPVRPDG
ncbi:MAG: lactonase family protein, partial [Verrucomicrobiaceae bacterium]|nr:lactonase family protein [Verrucomicrobiaceae bacterium]